MSKFSLFTVFLCSLIVLIVAEILVNDYLKNPYSTDLQTNIFQSDLKADQKIATQEQIISEDLEQKLRLGSSQQAELGQAVTWNAVLNPSNDLISAEDLNKIGFSNSKIVKGAFDGKIFDRIDVSTLNFLDISRYDIVQNGVVKMGSLYTLPVNSGELAKEIYGLLKDRSSAEIGVIVNETNSYGESSFYDNFFEFPERAFLVVKKGRNVYALTYLKELHPRVQMLLQLLP